MSTIFSQSDAAERIMAANLKSGSWGGSEAVCMMSALVSGAKSADDCVTAGWPKWLARLNVSLFDANVGADDEDAARRQFAMDVALAVQTPRDMDKARDLFLIATLERSKVHDTTGVTQPVIDLLHRRIAGEDVRDEMEVARAAADAAYAAARAAAYAAARAADAAAYAAAYAAHAARADAAYAARADLVAALNAS